MELWFTDQNSKPLEIEDKISITLVLIESVKYKKWSVMQFNLEMDFWILLKILFKNIVRNIGENLSGKYSQKPFHDAKWRSYEGDKELIFKNYE